MDLADNGWEIDELVPASGFIRHFVDYATKCTDAPEIYHVLAAISAASVAISDVTHLTMDAQDNSSIPLNVWHLLIGRSSLDRKSTSVTLASDVISSAIPDRIAPDSGSMEGLLEYLSENSTCIFIASELRALLDQFEASYWKQGKALLMDLYDGRETYSRKLKGKEPVIIHNPRVCLLGASALAMLGGNPNGHGRVDWTGGFFARNLMVYAERQRFQSVRKVNQRERNSLISELFDLSAIDRRKVLATRRARDVWTRFSWSMDRQARNAPDHLHGPICRLPDHVLKIAGIYAATADTDLGYQHMTQAVRLGRLCYKSIEQIGDRLTEDEAMRIRGRVLFLLQRNPEHELNRRDLLRNLKITVDKLNKVLQTLIAEDAVRIIRQGRTVKIRLKASGLALENFQEDGK